MVFQPQETSAELRIPILDESLGVEGTEDFLATLSIPASSMNLGVSAGSVDSVIVGLLDDDNVTVEFIMTEYEVSESVGEVTLYISSDTPGAVDYTLLVYLSNVAATGEYNTYTVHTYTIGIHNKNSYEASSHAFAVTQWLAVSFAHVKNIEVLKLCLFLNCTIRICTYTRMYSFSQYRVEMGIQLTSNQISVDSYIHMYVYWLFPPCTYVCMYVCTIL